MKTSFLIALALLLPFAKSAPASDGAVYSIIRTNSGKVYMNCSVYKAYPDHVILEFENGGANVSFADLSPEMREMLGYNPEKAAAYEKERAEKKRQEQQEQTNLAKYRAKTAKTQAKAARYQLTSMQGGYGGYAGASVYPYAAAYPYAGSYSLGYDYGAAGYSSNYDYGVNSASCRDGHSALQNSRYAQNSSIGSTLYGYGVDTGTRRGVTSGVPCRTISNVGNAWSGNGAWQGNSFNGRTSGSRAFCGTPALNVISRPIYNIPAPCRVPVTIPAVTRCIPSIGVSVRR